MRGKCESKAQDLKQKQGNAATQPVLQLVPLKDIQPNPGLPQPTREKAVEQLEELWPLAAWAARMCLQARTEGPSTTTRTTTDSSKMSNTERMGCSGCGPVETRTVDLIVHLLKQGTKSRLTLSQELHVASRSWSPQLTGRVHFLNSEEGAAIYWLWEVTETLEALKIFQMLQALVRFYHPYVQTASTSYEVANKITHSVQTLAMNEGLRRMRAALSEGTDAADPVAQDVNATAAQGALIQRAPPAVAGQGTAIQGAVALAPGVAGSDDGGLPPTSVSSQEDMAGWECANEEAPLWQDHRSGRQGLDGGRLRDGRTTVSGG